MIFTQNLEEPIYNSLKDLKSNKSINNWFNLAIYDEKQIADLAAELENILNKIPSSYFDKPVFDFEYFYSGYTQLSFTDAEVVVWFRNLFNSPRQLQKHIPLAILAFFNFSFLKYIIPENPNVTSERGLFKKASDSKFSSYYPVISKFKMLLIRHLLNLSME